MVFFLLIVMIVFASFMIVLNQNTGLEQTTIQAKQLDLDRYTELQTVSITNSETAVLNNKVYLLCDITNNGTLPTELVRLWIRDITNNTVGNVLLSPSLVIQPGSSIEYFKSVPVLNASNYDQFAFWFISTRGNTISAFPETNQFNGLVQDGNFPGVNAVNSTYATTSTPLQLSLTTTKPNQLIYVVVSYDDENYLTPLTSNPVLTWINRINSSDTDSEWGMNGDSTLGTYYAIKPSPGPITINIKSTTDEISDYYCSALAFAISDVNTTSPFDKGAPQTDIGKSIMPQDKITTTNSNEFIIGALCIDSLNPEITPGTDFAEIMPVQSSYGATGEPDALPRSVWSEWAILQNPRTNLSVNCTFTSTKNWAIIVDAVKLVVIPSSTPVGLSPSSGPIGQPVTVSGQGFAANSPLLAIFDGLQVPFSATTDSNGVITANSMFTVPLGETPGNKTVTIVDNNFNYANTTFLVTTPSITVSPTSGIIGTTINVTGSNFIDNSIININFAGNPTTTSPYPIAADPTGSFSATFNFNFNDSAGINQVMASDGVNSAFANFNVIPSITLNPTTGPIGSLVTVTGTGFAASQSVTATFAGAAVTTTPVNVNTDGFGFFTANFIVPAGQTFGAKNVVVTDANSNSAPTTFGVTPSISLSPISGNVGSTVTLSGSGFAANSVLALKFAGSTVTLGGTTRTDSFGAFTGATFTVPTWVSTWAIGSVQTVVITDAAANSGLNTFTVNTVTQSITVIMSNSAPSATVTINGGSPTPNIFAADGTSHSIIMFAGSQFTLSFSNSGNTRNGFIVASAFSASSISYTASVTPVTVTGFEQVQNTFSVTFIGDNAGSGDSLALAGTYLGASSSTITTLNSGNSWRSSSWSDYNTVVTFPVNTALTSSTQKWAINGPYSTAVLTSGGNTYSTSYYHQYPQTLSYSVFGGGSPTAPTATGTSFGVAYAPSLTNAATGYWFDASGSIAFSTSAGGVGEQWVPVPTSVLATSAQTQIVSMHHQYQVSFSQTGVDSSAGANAVLTVGSSNYAYNALPTNAWFDSGTTFNWVSTVSGGVGKQFVSTGSSGASPIVAAGAYSATYKTQYQHTITSSPTTGSGYITVDGVAQSTPYTTSWWDSGSTHTISASSTVTIVAGQRQYQYLSWSDAGAQSHTVSPTAVTTYTANFQQQFYFTVSSTYDSATGSGWYNAGTTISSTVTTPVSGGTGIQYVSTGWTGSGSLSSGGSAGSTSTGSFAINAYTTCTWNWKTQYQVSFSQTGVDSSAGANAVLTVGSSNYAYNALPTNAWFDSGTTFNWVSTVSGGVGKQFVSTGSSGASPIVAAGAYSATYKTQYQLTVTSAAGTSGGQTSGYYDSGTSISSSVSTTVNIAGPPSITYNSNGFTGTGNAPSSGIGTTVSFTLNQQSSITWHWNGQMTLDPVGNINEGIASENPSGSTHWVDVSDGSDNTYVYTTQSGSLTDSYSIQSVGSISGTISSVTQYMRIYTTSTNGAYATTSLTLGGITLTSGQFTPPSTITWNTHSDAFTRPGGGTWSMSDLNSLQSGITLHRGSGFGSQIRCSEVWIVVIFST